MVLHVHLVSSFFVLLCCSDFEFVLESGSEVVSFGARVFSFSFSIHQANKYTRLIDMHVIIEDLYL